MRDSLRVRLVLWYALVLTLVVVSVRRRGRLSIVAIDDGRRRRRARGIRARSEQGAEAGRRRPLRPRAAVRRGDVLLPARGRTAVLRHLGSGRRAGRSIRSGSARWAAGQHCGRTPRKGASGRRRCDGARRPRHCRLATRGMGLVSERSRWPASRRSSSRFSADGSWRDGLWRRSSESARRRARCRKAI